jgi:guanylate kinase
MMHSPATGKAVIFSAPSGSGKTTIVRHLLEHVGCPMGFSVSATTRPSRGLERDGVDYHFLTLEEFKKRVDDGAFVEWEEVYPGKCYGTLRSELERMWSLGETALFDVDVEGGVNLREALGDQALSVFIQPPSLEVLRARLTRRGTDSAEVIEERLKKAERELEYASRFDAVLVNDDLELACAQAIQLVREFIGYTLPTP